MSEPKKPHIFLFTGSDSFSISEKITFWRKEFEKKFGPGNEVIIDCESAQTPDAIIRELHTALRSHTLFSFRKIAIIRNIFSKTATATQVQDFFVQNMNNIPEADVIVFTSAKNEKKSVLLALITSLETSGSAHSDTFDILKGSSLRKWIHSRIALNHGIISPSALEYLAQRFDSGTATGPAKYAPPTYELWTIAHMIHILCSYAHGKEIAKKDIDLFVPISQDAHIFGLTDAIAERRRQRALQLAHTLIDGPQSALKGACIYLCALLIGQFRGLLLVRKLTLENHSEQDIARILDWDAKRVWVNKKKVASRTPQELQRILLSLIEYDYSLKTSSRNPLASLDTLLCSATQ